MNTDMLFIDGYVIPKSLSKQVIYELFDKVKKGDIAAREKIINHNIRLVLSRINKRFKNVEYDKKDLLSVGIIALISAVDTFDISKSTSFSTYAIICIDNAILNFVKKVTADKKICSVDETIFIDETITKLNMLSTLSSNINLEGDYIRKEVYSAIRKLVDSLPDKDREIIIMYFGFGDNRRYTQREIAEKYNVSQVYISRIINKILYQFGNRLEKYGLVEKRKIKKKENILSMNKKYN